MPRGDRTGPDGMGQMTGRGLGYCAGYDSPGFYRGIPRGGAGYGRRMGRGQRLGRGFRGGVESNFGYNQRPYYSPPEYYPQVSEKTLIENEIKIIGEQLKTLETRLAELSKEEK
ncbi:MAG: DUF5320 domain-containing protein [Armatimonadetes bacterium]|nr:DUF5320 domain-containing protein [Armatimonadota bacterium]